MELIDDYISLLSYTLSASVIIWDGYCLLFYYFAKDSIGMYVATRMSISHYFERIALRMNLQDISPLRLSLSLMGVLGLNSSFSIYLLQISNSYFFDVAVVFGGFVINAISLVACLFMLGGMRLRAVKERTEANALQVELETRRAELAVKEKEVEIKNAQLDTERINILTASEELNKAKQANE